MRLYPNPSFKKGYEKISYQKMGSFRQLTVLPAHVHLQLARRFRFASGCSRRYHSQHQPTLRPYTPTEENILAAALTHVPSQGFTAAALRSGARDTGFLEPAVNLFPSGAFAIVEYHLVSKRIALSEYAPSMSEPSTPADVIANLRALATCRLMANSSIIHQWQQALALLSMAKRVPTAIQELTLLSDELLYLAGSTTVSTSWYTNRAALAAIYASAELFMTTDTSKDFVETQAFLERRLDEGERLRGNSEMIGKWAIMQVGGIVDGLRSKGVWI